MLFGGTFGRRRSVWPALVPALVVCALVAVPAARAETFTVDSVGDQVDAVPGDESCETAGTTCTLRAAIEESDSLGESATIEFEEGTFEGQTGATIDLGSSLPPIAVPMFLNGRSCQPAATASGPCVGIDGISGEPALVVSGGEEVEIWGLAITGAQIAVSVADSPRFKAQASWFGIGLDGAPDSNATGILIGSGASESQVGGEGPEERNVIAASTLDGLDVHGSSKVRVLGNYFGVAPDGVTPEANGGDDVEVASSAGHEAAGTAIGTKVRPEGVATAECDLGCNVIADAAANGIDLEGDGGSETPAVATTIAGNYIGLGAGGTAAIANAGAGVRVGKAAQTVIGGPKAGEGNRINGGAVAVSAGPAAPDLVVYGNAIGADASGDGTLAPPGEGIVVNSGVLASAALEATIVSNVLRMQGGPGIVQRGFGARIAENEVVGAETGVRTFGSTEKHGNLIEGNLIEAAPTSGILIENNLNWVAGNEISGAGIGIWILGSPPFGARENLVGGDGASDENAIDGSGGDAIRITNPKIGNNEIARNRGTLNGGLFIDLVLASPGTETGWPNNEIAPPTLAVAAQLGAGGSAKPGATVRVFRKQVAAPGELDSFLGEAPVDGVGNWSLAYAEPLPAGAIVAATQTSAAGGTSELAIANTTGEAEAGGTGAVSGGEASGGNGAGAPGTPRTRPVDAIRPQTKIAKAPGRTLRRGAIARFVFFSNELGATFQCKLDRRPFGACESPEKYRHLGQGGHVFRVRSVDRAGNVDRSPAKWRFTVAEMR